MDWRDLVGARAGSVAVARLKPKTLVRLGWVTFPLLGGVFFAYGWAVLSYLSDQAGQAAWAGQWMARIAMALGLVLVGLVALAGWRGPERGMARFGLTYNLLLVAVMALLSESIPGPFEPSRAQTLLIEQLRRRNEEFPLKYRDVRMVPGRANNLGWLDRTHDFTKKGPRVLLIGDSMLEVRSRKRLALRIEELSARRRRPVEVVNLSMASSDPLDYRFRLNEYAFDYQPDHIYIFLYGPNDFYLDPPYPPYRSPGLRVTAQMVERAASLNLPPAVLQRLRQLKAEHRLMGSREELMQALGVGLSLEQQHLLFTLVSAYTRETRLPFLKLTHQRILNGGRRLGDAWLGLTQRAGFPAPANPRWWLATEFFPQHQAVYALPREQRLEALAQLFARAMGMSLSQPVRDLLKSQSQEFQDFLTAEPDMLVYLALPLNRLAGLIPPYRPPSAADQALAERRAEGYEQLLREMHETARKRGCGLTFVMIPSPQNVDRAWIDFWKPSVPEDPAIPTFEAVHRRIQGKLPLIDLKADPGLMTGAYWPFDGHWTEKGNDVVAEILWENIQRDLQR